MAGIYIHIPFCKSACTYCNFHFLVSQKYIHEYVQAITKEIALRNEYLMPFCDIVEGKPTIHTLYFGGGTPSQLSIEQLSTIFSAIKENYNFKQDIEITFEANPDDLNKEYLEALYYLGINRLSIGVQSFNSEDLKYLNRKHTPQKAIESIILAKETGFTNITIDLIYGIPTSNEKIWKQNIEMFLSFNLPHLSAYCLTVEPKTILDYKIRKNKTTSPDEILAIQQFKYLLEFMQLRNFHHYEISNFAKEGFYSKHNTAYWKGLPYLGLGASAHSYNGYSRQWNINNTTEYIKNINENILPFERECLTPNDKFNEYILTNLRTSWGCDLDEVYKRFGRDFYESLRDKMEPFISKGMLYLKDQKLLLSAEGKLIADAITSELFID